MSTAKERFDAFPSYEKEVREHLGDEGADKANAIIAIFLTTSASWCEKRVKSYL